MQKKNLLENINKCLVLFKFILSVLKDKEI